MPTIDPYLVLQVVVTAEQEVVHAAYRALAMKYHPDRDPSAAAARRMADLNAAYAIVRDAETRAAYDNTQKKTLYRTMQARADAATSTAAAAVPPPPRASSAGTKLEFGRYAGWTLRDLARKDPDYLRWLARHASGLRYRQEIYQVLGKLGVPAA